MFVSISAREAAELVEAAGIPDARRLLIDSAAAGLVKTYADAVATIGRGSHTPVRGGAIPGDLWHRIVENGDADGIWSGGTVRLVGNGLIGGTADVHVTGIRFGPGSLRQLIDRHTPGACVTRPSPTPVESKARATPPDTVLSEPAQTAPVAGRPARQAANPTAIPPGAITVTVNQAMEITGLGRTTIDKLMGDGTLERIKVGGRTLITVASIRRLLGTAEPK